MNLIKKIIGAICIALALFAGWFSITNIGYPKFSKGLQGNQSDLVFGIIMLFVLTPIIVGALSIFGWYALNNEYQIEEEHFVE
jgi:membrane protease YdiL (CAAX protease family)